MFVTNKRIKPPVEIDINGQKVKVVNEFKLLGVTIDSKLQFTKHVANVKLCIFRKLYSIKRLFNLCTAVKLQFFKTFVMPYFDYCSTLSCYFPKTTIIKLTKCFDFSIFRLFKLKPETNDRNDFNNKLEKYGLNNLQHRIIIRLSSFIHKIVNNDEAPQLLKNELTTNETHNKGYALRNNKHFSQSLQLKNHYGEATFNFVFVKLINNCFLNDLYINFSLFNKRIFNNINILYNKFIDIYPRFNT